MEEHGHSVSDPSSGLLWHLRWTVPVHLLLPVGLWWLMQSDPHLAAQVFLGIHLVCLPALVAVFWKWWAHSADLIAILFVNHVVSLTICVFLPW